MKLLIILSRKLYKDSSKNSQKTGMIIFLELKWESPKQSKHKVGIGEVFVSALSEVFRLVPL